MKLIFALWWVTTATVIADVQYAFTNFAGTPGVPGNSEGTAAAASFNAPFSVGRDLTNGFYVGDYYNHTIRKITGAGTVSTLAGTALAAGTNDATGSAARFNRPDGVVADAAGNIFVADTQNFTIRKITPGGVVTTFAGSAGQIGIADGQGTAARFYLLAGLAIDPGGNLYVADRYNHTIRLITPTAFVSTIAGLGQTSGTNDGTGNAARFNFPTCLALDANTNLFVADTGNHTIRKLVRSGTNWVTTTIAGFPGTSGTNDGIGLAARFNVPRGIAFDPAGDLYVADSNNHTIRRMALTGADWIVSTLGGTPTQSGTTSGTNTNAKFYGPRGIVFDAAGNMYVADSSNYRIAKGTLVGGLAVPPQFGSHFISGGQFHLQITNLAATPVVLEGSENLGSWQPLLTNSSALIEYLEPVSGTGARLFRAYLLR